MRILILIWLNLTFSTVANGSMYFEPTVGYAKGTTTLSTTSGTGLTATTSSQSFGSFLGPSIGAKFGWLVDYVYIVGDFRFSLLNVENQTTNSSQNFTHLGLGIGWDWNLPIRTFIVIDVKADTSIGDNSFAGGGTRMSIGYYLNLNSIVSLEFIDNSASTTTTSGELEASFSMTMITFSFPIEFLYPRTSWKEKVRQ